MSIEIENENIIDIPEEEDTLLPEGWAEGDDIFSEDEWTGEQQADEPGAEPAPGAEGRGVEPGEQTPTTETDPQHDDNGAQQESVPTTEQDPASAPRKLKFVARVDRADLDVEVDESEVPTLYQKAQVVDRVQAKLSKVTPVLEKAEQLSKSLGYASLDDMLNAAEQNYRDTEVQRLVGEGVHEEVAKDMVSRKMAPARGTQTGEQSSQSEAGAAAAENAGKPSRDFQREVQELLNKRPDLKDKRLPDEVVQSCVRGTPLIAAYMEYEVRQEKAESERLRKENQILKQNAASATKAPVSGTRGGGATDTEPVDDFLKGFNEDY